MIRSGAAKCCDLAPRFMAPLPNMTKAGFRILEQQLKTGFANVETTLAHARLRGVGIVLGGLAVATAILLTLG